MANTQINRKADRSAFTLVELMVTIVIIAILMGLILPGIGAMRRAARHRAALTQAMQIGAAVRQYKMIYSKWPAQTTRMSDQTFTINSTVIDALLNNPRDEMLIEIQASSLDGSGNYVDIWGSNPYIIAMDFDGDGQVTLSATLGSESVTTTIVNEVVAIMSWGEDPEKEHKRVYSWGI